MSDCQQRVLRVNDALDPGRSTEFAYDGAKKLSAIMDPDGRSTAISINGSGDLVQITHPDGQSTTLEYDDNHLLVRWQNPEGDCVTFSYLDDTRLSTVQTPGNSVTTFQYFDEARQRTITEFSGQRLYVTTVTLDTDGNVEGVEEPSGASSSYVWDGTQRLLSATDGRGNTTGLDYEEMDDLARSLSSLDRPIGSIGFEYDTSKRRVVIVTDLAGENSALHWADYPTGPDGVPGRLATLTNALGFDYGYAHTSAGQLASLRDPLGNRTTWTYDTNAKRIAIKNAAGETTTFAYGPYSQVDSRTNAEGESTSFVRDAMNRLESTTDPLSHTTNLLYDQNGQLIVKNEPLGRNTLYRHWPDGRLAAISTPLGFTTTYLYDRCGNLQITVDPLKNRTTFVYDESDRVASVVNALAKPTTYSYDAANNITTVTNAVGASWTRIFDANNRQVGLIDPLGNTTTHVYDDADRLVSVINPLGHTSHLSYDQIGQLLATADPVGSATTNTYDSAGRLIATLDPTGSLTSYSYDRAGRLLSTVEPTGAVHTYVYDAAGRQVASIDPLGFITTSTFDSAGNVVAVTDALGQATNFEYDGAARLTRTTAPGGIVTAVGYDLDDRVVTVTRDPDGLNAVTTTTYDPIARPLTVTSAEGALTRNSYDAVGRLVSVTNPRGGVTTNVYDEVGHLIEEHSVEGYITTHQYDAADRLLRTTSIGSGGRQTSTYHFDGAGRLVALTTPLGLTTSYAYDDASRVTTVTNGAGESTQSAYDAAGRQFVEVQPSGARTTYTYDTGGRLASTRIPSIGVTTSSYDLADRLFRVEEPGGRITTTLYDQVGRATGLQTADGARTTVTYDSASRSRLVQTPDGRVATYLYDGMLNTTAVVDGGGNRTTLVYDREQRLRARVDPLGNRSTYTYDPNGNLAGLMDAEGRVTSFSHSDDDLLNMITDPRSSKWTYKPDPAGNLATFETPDENLLQSSYDANGRVQRVTDANGAVATIVHDGANRIVSEQFDDGTKFKYAYDANGNLLTFEDPDGVTSYTYDSGDRITGFSDRGGTHVSYTYDARGFLSAATVSGVGVFTYTTDAMGRTTEIQAPDGSKTELGWDSVGRQTRRFLANDTIVSMSYDSAGRLSVLEHLWSDGGCSIDRYSFKYNGAGLRTLMTDLQSRTTTWTYDKTYQLLREQQSEGLSWNQLTPDQWYKLAACDPFGLPVDAPAHDYQFTYDGAGNTATFNDGAATTTYTYNTSNRLISSKLGISVTTYVNDAAGQRTKKTVPGPQTTLYAWNEDHRLSAVQIPGSPPTTVYYQYDASGLLATKIRGTDSWRFTWDGDRLLSEYNSATGQLVWYNRTPAGYGQLVSRHYSATKVFPLPDGVGSARKVFDGGKAIVRETDFDAFGVVTATSGSQFDSIEYAADSGYWRDSDTGLYYLRQRWYDAASRRFLSEDPVGQLGADLNLYRYTGNSPVNRLDPGGLDYLDRRDQSAFWVVQDQSSWRVWRPWYAVQNDLFLGQVVGARSGRVFGEDLSSAAIALTGEFGSGRVHYSTLERAASTFWNQYSDISSRRRDFQVKQVKAVIERLKNGSYREAPSAASVYLGAVGTGLNEGLAIQGDTFTFGLIGSLHQYADDLRSQGGLYTASSVLGVVARETLIGVLTAGSGAAISGSAKAAQIGGRVSPVLAKMVSLGQNSARMARAMRYANIGLRGYEAGQTVVGAYHTVKSFREGHYLAAAFGLGGTLFGGFGALRSFKLARGAVASRLRQTVENEAESIGGSIPSGVRAANGRPKVPWKYGDLGPGRLGATDRYGNITVREGIVGEELDYVLTHESVHRFLSVRETSVLARFRGWACEVAYSQSKLAKYIEEVAAETWATRSLRTGLAFPFTHNYEIGVVRLAVEAAGYVSIVGGAAYGGYKIGQRMGR